MQRITLPKIHACLRDLSPQVRIDDDIVTGARRALEQMLAVGRTERP
jgi:quinolinate synthase